MDIMKGRQEDAEEFLIIFMDLLDKEMNAIKTLLLKNGPIDTSVDIPLEHNDTQTWTEVDRKQKTMKTRTVFLLYFCIYSLD